MQRTVARLLEQKGTDVWSIGPDAMVFDALEVLAAKGIGALVVLDGEELVGIMSERDYARRLILEGRDSRTTSVEEIMTTEVHTVTRDATTSACMELMTELRIRHLPVVEEGRLMGLVSIGDVVRAVIEEQRFLIEQLENYITG